MQFHCPECGHEYIGPETMTGGKARCASCRRVFVIAPDGETPPGQPAPPSLPAIPDIPAQPRETGWLAWFASPATPVDRQRTLRRFLKFSAVSLKIVTILGLVGGVLGLIFAYNTYRNADAAIESIIGVQKQQGQAIGELKELVGVDVLPLGGLEQMLGQYRPSPWIYLLFPALVIVGSLLLYIWGSMLIHFVHVVLDMEQSNRELMHELRQRAGNGARGSS